MRGEPTHLPKTLPLVLAAAVVGISVSGPLVRLSGAEPLAIAVWRLTFALAMIAVFLAATGSWREYRTLARRDIAVALGAGFFLALHLWSWIASIGLTTVAASVVLVNLHPVVMIAGSALWLGERPTRLQVVAVCIALLGAAAVAFGGATDDGAPSNPLLGNTLALLGALAVGIYYLAGRSIRQRLSIWPYVGLVYAACLVSLLTLAAISGAPLLPQPRREWLIFAAMAIGPMMLGHTSFNWMIRYVPAYVVSLALLAEPVGATLIAAVMPGISEIPGVWTLAGGGVILFGLILGTLEEDRTASASRDSPDQRS